jgi:hypothetical protein
MTYVWHPDSDSSSDRVLLNDVWKKPSGETVPCAVRAFSAIPGYVQVVVEDAEHPGDGTWLHLPSHQVERP